MAGEDRAEKGAFHAKVDEQVHGEQILRGAEPAPIRGRMCSRRTDP